jgi:hypothetical protein
LSGFGKFLESPGSISSWFGLFYFFLIFFSTVPFFPVVSLFFSLDLIFVPTYKIIQVQILYRFKICSDLKYVQISNLLSFQISNLFSFQICPHETATKLGAHITRVCGL